MVMKRLSSPRTFPVTRKSGGRFVTQPMPGPHPKDDCIPLSLLIKELTNFADTSKEAKTIIKSGKVLVDGKKRYDHKFPVGIFDTITIVDENYRIIPSEKGFSLISIDKKESSNKLCKISNKTIIPKGKVQINLNDGKNIILDKNQYKTGDSLIISLLDGKIIDHVPRKEGAQCIVTRGRNRSKIGTLTQVEKVRGSGPNIATIKIDEENIRVPEDIVFIVSKDLTVVK